MNTIEQLRQWAGVSDSSADATLRQIEAGVISLLEKATHRQYISPIETIQEELTPLRPRQARISRLIVGAKSQWVTLNDDPVTQLSGTWTVTSNSTTITGTNGNALTELSANPSTAVTVGSLDPLLIESIIDDNTFTVTEIPTLGAIDQTATAAIMAIQFRNLQLPNKWLDQDPRNFEVSGRRIYSPDYQMHHSHRTVRVKYRRGFAEGDGPADAALWVLEAVGLWYRSQEYSPKRVRVEGGFEIEWGAFGADAAALLQRAQALAAPIDFGG